MIIKRIYQGIELKLDVGGSTYKPDKFTRLMADSIKTRNANLVVDVGTGNGALAIVSKKLGARRVIGTDVVRSYKKVFERNCELNNSNIEFRISDLLSNIKENPDIIIANLAQTPFPKKIDSSKWGGPDGADKIRKIIKQAYKKLKKGGILYLGVISLSNPKSICSDLRRYFKVKKINEMRRYITPKIANRWQKGFFDYLLKQHKAGKAFMYKDGGKRYYKFFIFEAKKSRFK